MREFSNTSTANMILVRSVYNYFAIADIIVSIANIVTNSILVHSLRKLKKFNTVSYKFILFLSISDICNSISLTVSAIAFYCATTEAQHAFIDVMRGGMMFSFSNFSGFMIVSIAVDRYIHIRHFSKYNQIVTKQRATILVIFLIFMSLAFDAFVAICRHYGVHFISQMVINSALVIGLAITCQLYFGAYRSVKRRTNAVNQDSRIKTSVVTPHRNAEQEFLLASALITITLVLCLSPYVIVSTIRFYDLKRFATKTELAIRFAEMLICLNSSFNAFILVSFNSETKRYVKRQLCRKTLTEVRQLGEQSVVVSQDTGSVNVFYIQ